MKTPMITGLAVGSSLLAALLQAQAPPQNPSEAATTTQPPAAIQKVLGEVTALDAAQRQMTVRPESGAPVTLATEEATSCLRTLPGAKDLSGATPIGCAEIVAGDRVFARGLLAADGTTVGARQIVVMTRSDLVQRQERDKAEWRRRGIAGVVKSLDPATSAVTLEVRSLAGSRDVVVATGGDRPARFRRYAPGSARYADAQPSAFAELRVGDQVRALGDRTDDGTRLVAEQVVAGAFRTLVGSVEALGPEANELTLSILPADPKDKKKEKRVVVFGPAAPLRRLPDEMAQRLARRPSGGPSGGAPDNAGPGERRPRSQGGGGTPSLADMLDRFPTLALADLAKGEYVAVVVAEGGNGRSQATVLLAGIEPLIREQNGNGRGRDVTPGLAQGALDLGMGGGGMGGGE